jgi:hypothetical protein
MDADAQALPDDVEALKAALLVARAEVAAARARASDDHALIAHLKLEIEKLNRERFASVRSARRGCSISWQTAIGVTLPMCGECHSL